MKILTGSQIKELDNYTIENEPIESVDLMERASEAMAQIVAQRTGGEKLLAFVVGKGNNGGDGLAMARMLANAGCTCCVMMASHPEELSDDCRFNLDRLPDNVQFVDSIPEDLDDYEVVVIDALLGSGVKGCVTGRYGDIIREINSCGHYVISVDLPSGMQTEFGNDPDTIVHADLTLTIEFPKLAMLLPEAGECCGEIEVVDIGLDRDFIDGADSPYQYVTDDLVRSFIKERLKFSHKGSYGHTLLVCGSEGMYGAAVLSTTAALRSGCGLVTVHTPRAGVMPLMANAPSAMISCAGEECFSSLPVSVDKYTSVGVGCGVGQSAATQKALGELLQSVHTGMVIDADALNIIAANPHLRTYIPTGSILTPHLGELRRLVGEWSGEQDKIAKSSGLACELSSIVVVKGAYTMICMPDGRIYFNPTGTPGMAKGGSGDVLTGLLTGLLSRRYNAEEATILGVYVHGLAGEKAAEYFGVEAMNSSDIVDFIGDAFGELTK